MSNVVDLPAVPFGASTPSAADLEAFWWSWPVEERQKAIGTAIETVRLCPEDISGDLYHAVLSRAQHLAWLTQVFPVPESGSGDEAKPPTKWRSDRGLLDKD